MRRAAKVSAAAHIRAMQVCRPGMMEYELEAEYAHEFRRGGCGYAYPPIVGGGDNGCILHYTENNQVLEDGDLVLIDAGAEYFGYAGDVTRTFPVSGTFSPVQRELYELVLESQLAAIEQSKPGNHWNDPHTAAGARADQGFDQSWLAQGDRPLPACATTAIGSSICIAQVIGWAWMCTTSANTKFTTTGACSNPAWCSP